MNINNLSRVSDLNKRLKEAMSRHRSLTDLTASRGYRNQVVFNIGGDEYGNGLAHRVVMPILDSPEAVAICRKLQSEAWSKVVSIRASLRELGVNIDEAKS